MGSNYLAFAIAAWLHLLISSPNGVDVDTMRQIQSRDTEGGQEDDRKFHRESISALRAKVPCGLTRNST